MMTGCRQSPGSTCPRRGMGRLWRGMGGDRPPRRQHGLLGFYQPRITQHVFLLSSGDSNESNSKPGLRGFHESRDTRHESRPLCFCRCFPSRRGAASGGYGAAWAAVVPRAGNTACWVFTSRETRNMVFPCSSGDSNESNSKPGLRGFHESRDTKHESRPLCFSSHDFPRFPGISRYSSVPPLPPESVSARRPPPRARCRPQNRAR